MPGVSRSIRGKATSAAVARGRRRRSGRPLRRDHRVRPDGTPGGCVRTGTCREGAGRGLRRVARCAGRSVLPLRRRAHGAGHRPGCPRGGRPSRLDVVRGTQWAAVGHVSVTAMTGSTTTGSTTPAQVPVSATVTVRNALSGRGRGPRGVGAEPGGGASVERCCPGGRFPAPAASDRGRPRRGRMRCPWAFEQLQGTRWASTAGPDHAASPPAHGRQRPAVHRRGCDSASFRRFRSMNA